MRSPECLSFWSRQGLYVKRIRLDDRSTPSFLYLTRNVCCVVFDRQHHLPQSPGFRLLYPLSPCPANAHAILQLQPLWDFLDNGVASTTASFETRIYDLIPPNKVFSHYMGSLTTRPCTEVRAVASVARKQEMTIGQASIFVSVLGAFFCGTVLSTFSLRRRSLHALDVPGGCV